MYLFFVLATGVLSVTGSGDPAFATKPVDNLQSLKQNVTECAQQVLASMTDVEYFFRKSPQKTNEGKCFVACILTRYGIIKNKRVDEERVKQINREIYNDDVKVKESLEVALKECSGVEKEFQLCEYVSKWNDCVHLKMTHVPDWRRHRYPPQPSHAEKLGSKHVQRLFEIMNRL